MGNKGKSLNNAWNYLISIFFDQNLELIKMNNTCIPLARVQSAQLSKMKMVSTILLEPIVIIDKYENPG